MTGLSPHGASRQPVGPPVVIGTLCANFGIAEMADLAFALATEAES
jgi:hypothetical protein